MDGFTNNSPTATKASPMQQKQFDLLLGRAREMMGANGEQWMAAIKADPVQTAVTMGTSTIRELAMMSEKAGQKVDPAVLLHVGIQFVKDIAGVANAAGALPDEEIEAFLKDVMSQSMAEYLKMDAEDGLITPQGKKDAQGILSKMQGGSPGEPAPQAAPQPAPPMEQAEPTEDDPEMAAELAAIRAKKGGM